MKLRKKLLCLCAALCLLLSAVPGALAENAQGAEDDARFFGKTWEQVTEDFILEHHADSGTVTIGYYNTVTGEENYWRGDEYMTSGSMYKVPLNMIYTDRITSGEMDWDSEVCGYRYERALEESIVYSNNDISQAMAYALGGGHNWHAFREVLAPYMCEDPENVEEMFYKNNYSTARQMIFALKLLYHNPDRFPRIIDLMKKAEPNNYFLKNPQKVEVAHKYGYLEESFGLCLNDCGVVYTEDPFCLVVFTAGIVRPYEFLTEYCALMIDYTEYHTALRHEEELQRAREEAILAMNPASSQEAPASAEPRALNAEASVPETGEAGAKTAEPVDIRTPILAVIVFGLTAAALVGILKLGRKKQLRILWALPALLCAAAALLLCLYAPAMKPTVSVTVSAGEERADPQDCVRQFFDSLIRKDYETAYGCLYDYASLGLEDQPESEAARLMADALFDSFDYSLFGDCQTEGLSAGQQVIFDTLDLNALQDDLKAGTEARVQKLSDELPRSQVVDENGDYLPEITQQAYLDTLRELLSHPARYRTSVGLQIDLTYTVKGWRILTDTELIQALSGRPSVSRGGDSA